MGGKQKQAQRTKGNVRPSSSARAAEALAASGTLSSGFVGFGALSGDLGYVPATQGKEEADSSVDADFRMVLRKLSKRDSTTKIKALQEFATFCNEKDEESVKTVLPFWPRVYSKLTVDNDRRVREMTQQAFENLVLRVGRNLAPQLRGLMGSWLVAQCDSHAPAASAAKAAFQTTFPKAKQADAIWHCQDEVLSHIHENLIVHSPQTLSDPKVTESEDMEAKYMKVVSANLLAWKLFIHSVPAEKQLKVYDKYTQILDSPKFWKFHKHQSCMIRGSFFAVISALCSVNLELARKFSGKICPAVLCSLDEKEPVVCQSLWEAVLHVISSIEDCWKVVSPRKGVLPNLWSMLRAGGFGSATVIYPNLLPFLSRIPEEVIGPGTGFYSEFFNNMKTGLCEERARMSPGEMRAIIHNFLECLRYSLIKSFSNSENGQTLRSLLIEDQLLPLILESFSDQRNKLSNSPLYSLIVDLLMFLQESSLKSENPEKAKLCGECNTLILENLKSSVLDRVESAGSTNLFVLDRIYTFLSTFMSSSVSVTNKKKVQVKFAEETTMPATTNPEERNPKQSCLIEPDGPVFDMISETCRVSFMKFKNSHSVSHLTLLSRLINVFQNVELLTILDPVYTEEKFVLQNAPKFLGNVVIPWLEEADMDEDRKKAVQDCVVDVMMCLMNIGGTTVKLEILTYVCQNIDDTVLIYKFIRRTYNELENKAIRDWFKDVEFGQFMVYVTKQLCENCLQTSSGRERKISACWDLLKLALSADEGSGPVAGVQYVEQILLKIQQTLPSKSQQLDLSPVKVDRCVCFVCDVAAGFYTSIKGCMIIPAAEDLLLALFKLSTQPDIVARYVQEKVNSTWQLGITGLMRQKGAGRGEDEFISKLTRHIKSVLLEQGHSLDRLEVLMDLTLAVTECMKQSLKSEDQESYFLQPAIETFMSQMLLPFDHSCVVKEEWEAGPYVLGDLILESKPLIQPSPPVGVVPKAVIPTAFTSMILSAVSASDHWKDTVIIDRETDFLLDHAFAVGYCKALMGNRHQAYQNTTLGKVYHLLSQNFKKLCAELEDERRKFLINQVMSKSYREGGMWAISLEVVLHMANKWTMSDYVVTKLSVMEHLNTPTLAAMQTVHFSIPFLPMAELDILSEVLTALIISCSEENLATTTGGCGYISLLSKVLSVQEDCLSEMAAGSSGLNKDFVISVLDQLCTWQDKLEDMFSFDSIATSLDWPVVEFNRILIQFMQVAVSRVPHHLSASHWDFIMCAMVSWIQSCYEGWSTMRGDISYTALTCQASSLLVSVSHCMNTVLPEQKDEFPPDLKTEWLEFFSEAVYGNILPHYMHITESVNLETPNASEDFLLKSIGRAVSLCPGEHIRVNKLPAKLLADAEGLLPDDIQTTLNHFCPLLLAHNRSVQITAYRLLYGFLPELSNQLAVKERVDESVAGDMTRQPPPPLLGVLDTSQAGLDVMLVDLKFGETSEIEAYSTEFHITMGYLLCWKLLLAFFRGASSELRAEYAQFIRDAQIVDTLLVDLFRIMPQTPIIHLHEGLTTQSPLQKLSSSKSMFGEEPVLDGSSECGARELQHVACAVYYRALQDIPAIIRQWWANQDKRIAGIMERFTSKFVSPELCSQELSQIHNKDVTTENMTVKTRTSTREVIATYSVQEFTMELIVTLPSNHPLGVVSVETGKHIRVPNTHWRNWLLQLITFLTHQNGSLLDGLLLWKRNVDKRFEGVEECMICFSVLHNTNYQLPKLQCKVCKKKFHSACLYKWFSTSNKSTCPLCRSLF